MIMGDHEGMTDHYPMQTTLLLKTRTHRCSMSQGSSLGLQSPNALFFVASGNEV